MKRSCPEQVMLSQQLRHNCAGSLFLCLCAQESKTNNVAESFRAVDKFPFHGFPTAIPA